VGAGGAFRFLPLASMTSLLTVTSDSQKCCALSGEQYLRMLSSITNDQLMCSLSPDAPVHIE
jgi:hypothetical protein